MSKHSVLLFINFVESWQQGGSMWVVRCNLITLAIIGFLDLKHNWIPNAIILGWLTTIFFGFNIVSIPVNPSSVGLSLVTVGIFFPLRRIVKCCAGDFKLYAVLMLTMEPSDSLGVCFMSMAISLIPLASGIKYVPIGLTTLFGYVTFLLFRIGEMI